MEIGSKLKELRVLKGLTQEELTGWTELSRGFISQLKCDPTFPSIAILMNVLQCLGTTIDEFFSEALDEQVVFSKQDYSEKIDTDLNNKIKWTIPSVQKNIMEPILLALETGDSAYPDNPHEGEEFRYVPQRGTSIHIGNKTYKARKGGFFYLTSDKKHYLTSKNGAPLLWVSSPPSF